MNSKTGSFVKKMMAMALVITMACPYVYAADVGKVTYVEGRVDISKEGSDIATPLREGDTVAIGDAIRTKSNSKAEVTFNDKSMLRLAQNTRIQVKDYALDADNKRKTAEIMVDRGKARTIIAKMPDKAEFNISTPNAKGTVKGSDVFTSFQAGSSNMLVAEGRLSVINPTHPGKELVVPAGSSVIVPMDEAPQASRAYLELERKMHEADTSIPQTIYRDPNAVSLKGAFVGLSGDVRITPKETGVQAKATINDIIGEGDIIETGVNGLADIIFQNGNGLSLKENTKIAVTTLVQDPKTGQYDNKFDLSMGKVKARIEKIKETKSTFEVRTPTAICGARATLMYIEISPTRTRCFFEGGWGDLQSAISGMKRQIEMGNAAYSDVDGNISDQFMPSETERMEWTGNWGAGNGTEGYSAPGDTVGVLITSDGGTGGDVNVNIIHPEPQNFFSDPLFEVGGTTGGLTVVEEPVTSSGSFYGKTYHYGSEDTTGIQGVSVLTGTFWDGETANLTSEGTYSSEWGSPFVWFGSDNPLEAGEGETINEGFLYSHNPTEDTHTTYDGGAFYGDAVGIADGGIMDGFMKLLYIDPSGNIGIADGVLEGLISGGDYIFTGDIVSEFEVAGGWVGDVPVDYVDWVYTGYSGSSSNISGSFTVSENQISAGGYLRTYSILDYVNNTPQNWGIYTQDITGGSHFMQTEDLTHVRDSAFSMVMGGYDIFGVYTYENTDRYTEMVTNSYDSDYGYWIANTSNGSFNSDYTVSADVNGRFITYTKMGDISGDIFGAYDGSGFWNGVGIGTWGTGEGSTTLNWSADIDAAYHYFDDSDGYIYYDDSGDYYGVYGIIGAATSPLTSAQAVNVPGTAQKFTVMGEAYPNGCATWWGYLYGSYAGDGSNIPDGFIGGRTDLNSMSVDGFLITMYVDSYGYAGTISGSFSGDYFDDINMWMAEGTDLIATKRVAGTGYYTVNWDYYDYDNGLPYIDGYFDGNFTDEDGEKSGAIYSDSSIYDQSSGYYGGYTAWLVDITDSENPVDQNWGIYSMELGGCYSRSIASDNWRLALGGDSWRSTGECWIASVDGSKWSDGFLDGDMEGVWFKFDGDSVNAGSIKGKVMGDYTGEYIDVDEKDTWQAISAGEWVEVTDLLTADKLGFDAVALQQFVSVPVTEVYSNILNGVNGGMSATANIALYQNIDFANIWTMLLSGNYTADPSAGWNLQLNQGSDVINLQNGTWVNGTWTANVAGTVGGNTATGQAGGTYGDGTFTGVGAGTWQAPDSGGGVE